MELLEKKICYRFFCQNLLELISGPDIILAATCVLGNFSRIILINTVIGIDIIRPGMPQIYPHSISIISTVITFKENVFPINTGFKIPPIISCTDVMQRIKNNKVPVGSISTKANSDKNNTEMNEPTI